MALLKAVVVSQYLSQEFMNSLWYETIPSDPVGIDYVAAARGLGEWVRDTLIVSALGETRWVNLVPADTSISRVSVMAYNPPPLGTSNPVELLTAPQDVAVNALSANPGFSAFAPQATYILRLRCAAQTLNPLDYTPPGGYLAIGPAGEASVFSSGELDAGTVQALNNFGAGLLAVAQLGSGYTAAPVRVGARRRGNPLGVATYGWSRITSVAASTRVSWRRSRTPR
jgi:hypothetical protein